MTRRLHTAAIPDNALRPRTGDSDLSARLSKLPGLSGAASVSATGQNPDEVRLDGQFTKRFAETLQTELLELLTADALDELAFFGTAPTPADGYYTVESASGGRVRPQEPRLQQFAAQLVREGTRATHRRAVRAGPTDARQVEHDFGSATTAEIGIPATATQVRWVSNDTTSIETASPTASDVGELGTVDLYDLEQAPAAVGDRPYLAYDLPYADAGAVDSAVFDTYGRAETVDGAFAWQQVFRADHEFRGLANVRTGVVETTLDPDSTPGIDARRWDSGAGAFASVSLGASSWTLDEVDLVRPGAAHVRAQLTFRDTSGGGLYPLDAYWHRGQPDVQFAIPATETGPIPAGLVTLLDPIASASVLNPLGERTLLRRSEVRA